MPPRQLSLTSSAAPVTLRSISGKSVSLKAPVTLGSVLKAAAASPFNFDAESVKIHLHGRLVYLQRFQREHGTDLAAVPLDPSAYAPTRAGAAGPFGAATSSGAAAVGMPASARSVIIYGVPARVAAAQTRRSSAAATASAAPATGCPGVASPGTSGTGSPRAGAASPAVRSAPGIPPASSTAATSRRASQPRVAGAVPAASAAVPKGPLPYPYSPDGLRELAKECMVPDLEDEEDLIALLQGAPQRIYEHPTMKYMSSKVNGDLIVLKAVMEQIAAVSPVFFDWICANSQTFLAALNRGGERSLQQVRDQLRMLALRAMAEQMSGEAPSRHVMMLEVNTRDGSPDVYQVEVQVGDFSDGATPSESLLSTSMDDDEEMMDDMEEMEEGAEDDDEEDGYNSEDEEEYESNANMSTEEVSGLSGGRDGTDDEVGVGVEHDQPHRGAIELRDVASLPPVREGAAAAPLAPVPPPAAAALSTASAALPPIDEAEDARLAGLRAEVQRADDLIQQWATLATPEAASCTHRAITTLRMELFAVLADLVATATSNAASLPRCRRDVRRLVLLACRFFAAAEEFYVQMDEQGVRGSVFGDAPEQSIAAWAVVAALSRLLMCDADAAVEAYQLQPLSASASGPRRVSALRALQPAAALWSSPALRWATPDGPERLVKALLQLCRQQRAVLVLYSCHYVIKAVGKTIQTVAYVLGGIEEAQQPVSLQRLKLTSKAHKQDEVAECLTTLAEAEEKAGAVPEGTRRQWFKLMRDRYQQFVGPLEKDLPTPHLTSYPLYVCDTRHVLPPKEGAAETGRALMGGAARWWAGYCDERHTCCADKWCLVTATRPWNAVSAMENAAAAAAPADLVTVVVAGSSAENRGTDAAAAAAALPMPVEAVSTAAIGAAAESSGARAPARHTAVLCEHVVVGVDGSAPSLRHLTAAAYTADLRVVDAVVGEAVSPQLPGLRLLGAANGPTHLATVVRNYVLPSAASVPPVFLRHLFDKFAKFPRIPAAAAVRDAALANARAQDAPWLVCEYVLCDYGAALTCFAEAASRETERRTAMSATAPPMTSASLEAARDELVQMPRVPLSKRLSTPRPLPPTQLRPVRTTVRRPLARASTSSEEAAKRLYARTHAIDALYEMMLGSLLEQQPTGEAAVLDHLIHYMETSRDAMDACVRERQAEAAAASTAGAAAAGAAVSSSTSTAASPNAAAAAAMSATAPVMSTAAASAAKRSSGPQKPQPPSGKRGSFSRRRL